MKDIPKHNIVTFKINIFTVKRQTGEYFRIEYRFEIYELKKFFFIIVSNSINTDRNAAGAARVAICRSLLVSFVSDSPETDFRDVDGM